MSGVWRRTRTFRLAGLIVLGLAIAVTSIAVWPAGVRADGGRIRVSDQVFGSYKLTVYTTPTPPRVGMIDVSALVQNTQSGEVARDARVWVTIEPVGHDAKGGTFEATKEQATTRDLVAAEFKMPSKGTWRMTVRVEGPGGAGQTSFDLDVSGAGVLGGRGWLIWLLAVPIVLAAIWWIFSGDDDDDEEEEDERAEAVADRVRSTSRE